MGLSLRINVFASSHLPFYDSPLMSPVFLPPLPCSPFDLTGIPSFPSLLPLLVPVVQSRDRVHSGHQQAARGCAVSEANVSIVRLGWPVISSLFSD